MIKPEDAFLILKGWQSESKQLDLTASFFGFAVTSRGRIVEVADSRFVFDPEGDESTRMIVDLSGPETAFLYAEPREFSHADPEWFSTVPESAHSVQSLGIAFPLRVPLSNLSAIPSTTEKIILIERVDPLATK